MSLSVKRRVSRGKNSYYSFLPLRTGKINVNKNMHKMIGHPGVRYWGGKGKKECHLTEALAR